MPWLAPVTIAVWAAIIAAPFLGVGFLGVGGNLARLPLPGQQNIRSGILRAGTLDAFYLRPQPILLQLITSDVSLRRLARAGVGAAALGIGLATSGVPRDMRTVVLLLIALVSGYATFAGLFVWAAGLQFFLLDGATRHRRRSPPPVRR